ncbi:BQ2448_6617 [Microbotryum intermedium]|uniref:BQ2448_6617 protein n=1 Tax=Microbotryum intermedium TaxID=269621 RepID=A0A238FLZ5_9BASI|nr:BQ2448_6617 [Microbotryum intermedium]
MTAFIIIRNRFRKIYNPRSYLVPPSKRVDPLPPGLLNWIPYIFRLDSKRIITQNGLDAYVFVRFLYLMMEIFLPFWIVTDAMTQFCSILPGGVKRVWIVRDLKELPDLYDRRRKACSKLESAEFKLLRIATKMIAAKNQKQRKSAKKKSKLDEVEISIKNEAVPIPDSIQELVSDDQRPKHKLGLLGMFGQKVDTIEWARAEIATTTEQLEMGRAELYSSQGFETYPPQSAAFIQFNEQIAAHMFSQMLCHHTPLRMSAKWVEVDREDVIWRNLSVNPSNGTLRYAASWAATVGLIILWSFPVAFVGSLSNVSALCISTPWLAWLCKIPVPLNGIIQGALPPVALAILFILLPIILRIFARVEGIPLRSQIELSLMDRYFLILVIHGFLVVTLASGLVKAIPVISKNPGSAVTLLATQLPSASTFFLTYFVTTAIAGAAGGLLQIITLAIFYVKLFLLGSTPRTMFPGITLLTVIGLSYSIISPLITGFTFVTFFLYWFLYKVSRAVLFSLVVRDELIYSGIPQYLLCLVIDTPREAETGGLFYPKAITHIFVGLYIELVCLAGLFFLARDTAGKAICIPHGALTIVLIIFTILFQLTMKSGYDPLIANLPLSFAGKIAETQALYNNVELPESPRMGGEKASQKEGMIYPPEPAMKTPENEERDAVAAKAERAGTLPGEEHLDVRAFDPPATYEGYPCIWIPQDQAGYWRAELEASQAAGVDVSSEGAMMDEKGHVHVERAPPGEDWDSTQAV